MKTAALTHYISDRNVFHFVLLICFFLPLPFVSAADDNSTNIVVAFGDSITRGVGGVKGYPANLGGLLVNCAVVQNKGVNGEQTYSGVNRIKGVLINSKANYILIMEGANDIIWGVSPSSVKFNLGRMIEISRANGAIPILSTITPNTRDRALTRNIPINYNPPIRSLAVQKGVVLIDQYQNVIAEWPQLTLEGLHPNEAGAQRLAEGFSEAIPCSDGGGGGCFIATAAFGTALEPQVERLKQFRDEFLLTNRLGTLFVQKYYQYSPPVADYIGRHESLRAVVRLVLYPLIGLSYVMTEFSMGLGLLSLGVLFILGILLFSFVLLRLRKPNNTALN